MNLIIGIICIILCFSAEVILERIFKKEGLYVWIAVALVTANILVTKQVDILNLSVTLGNILFASTFLATDILNEKYSVKDSRKAINIGILSVILFTIATQISLLFKPNGFDFVNDSLKTIFSFNFRINIASITMCYLSNLLDIYLFEKIKKKFPKHLFIRNNVATIISNCLENYIFMFLAFIGFYSLKDIFVIATATTIVELLIALCDTPFLYLATKGKRNEQRI